jgi:hypothetical protein
MGSAYGEGGGIYNVPGKVLQMGHYVAQGGIVTSAASCAVAG